MNPEAARNSCTIIDFVEFKRAVDGIQLPTKNTIRDWREAIAMSIRVCELLIKKKKQEQEQVKVNWMKEGF